MSNEATSTFLYLDIMKRCLTDSIFDDDPLAAFIPIKVKADKPAWKRTGLAVIQKLLSRYGMKIVEPYMVPWQDYSKMELDAMRRAREGGENCPARAHTMIGRKRLDNLQSCVETVLRENIPGDLIETGVWRGGSCIFMRAILAVYGDARRNVWVADSFAGLPPPSPEKYAADEGDKFHTFADFLAISRAEVEQNFRRYGLLDERVCFLEGWFKDTLPNAPIDRLAVIRLDGDMYESTYQAIEALYDKLSSGGFVIVDDYFLKPCAKAIHDFRALRGIADPIHDIDGIGSFWRRGSAA